jgi:osmotically inducible lipoprotein OsmB
MTSSIIDIGEGPHKPGILLVLVAMGLPLTLAACGDTTQDRALSGAGIGAAGGAILGAVTPIGRAGGALIEGAAGGATGALTTPSAVNLGRPVWRYGSLPSEQNSSIVTESNIVSQIQAELQRRVTLAQLMDRSGQEPKPRSARNEQQHGLLIDGIPSASLLAYRNAHPTG